MEQRHSSISLSDMGISFPQEQTSKVMGISYPQEQTSKVEIPEGEFVYDIWTGPVLNRLYVNSLEGLEWIREILSSTEIASLVERLRVWGTGLFEGPQRLDEWSMGGEEESCIYFLTRCFARICLNIEIILITLESRDTGVLSYLRELSFLLKGGSEQTVTIPSIIIAKIDSAADVTPEEKLLKYFDNIEDDVELLYEMLPAIYIARHLTCQHRQTVDGEPVSEFWLGDDLFDQSRQTEIYGKDTGDENALLRLVDEDLGLAEAIAKSLKTRGKKEEAKGEKSPMEWTVKLFEAEIDALHKWRNVKERITQEMALVLTAQAEAFRAMDETALDNIDPKEMQQLLERFQVDNKFLQQLSEAEASASNEIGLKRDEKWNPSDSIREKRNPLKGKQPEKAVDVAETTMSGAFALPQVTDVEYSGLYHHLPNDLRWHSPEYT